MFDLNSIKRGPTFDPPRLVITGPHGCGKTTMASEAPDAILLPTEDGYGTLDFARFPIAKSYSDMMEAISTLLHEPHEFKTFVIDSIDWAEPMVLAETCRRNSWADIETPGYGRGYTAADDVWRELLGGLSTLRAQRGMQVVLIAHSRVERFEDPSTDGYDRYSIKLHKRASALVQEWADAVLFMNMKSYTKTTDTGFNKKVTRGVGLGERVIYTEERPAHLAKNRYSLPPEIPAPKGQAWAALAAHMFAQS